jgi:isochorismate synthase
MTDIIIMNTLLTTHIAQSHPFSDQHKSALLATLQEAAIHARQLEQDVIASFTLPIQLYDALQAFTGARQAGLGNVFLWEQPSEHNALVGVGIATTITTNGPADAALQWRALMRNAVISYAENIESIDAAYGHGPLFFGGFAFDSENLPTPLWADFPAGLLILPRFLLLQSGTQTALSMHMLLHAHENVERCFQQLLSDAESLLTAIENSDDVVKRKDVGRPQGSPLHIGDQTEQDSSNRNLAIQDILSASEWMQKVEEVASDIRQGRFEKVVLARSVQVTPDEVLSRFSIETVLSRLRASYPSTYVFALQSGGRFFVGATPERLVQAQNGQIHTMALAGSAPRGTTIEEDERIGTNLLQSEKNAIEHSIVVARVRAALLTHCQKVSVSATPRLLKLRNVQHLETPIVAELLPGRCILDVIADLHPTPAVGGFPHKEALAEIRAIEQMDRGWYAGPIGWIGASGHGEFAVALRSGLISEHEATLFAGCGIVGDSNPQSEYEESCLKLQVMLRGLGEQN